MSPPKKTPERAYVPASPEEALALQSPVATGTPAQPVATSAPEPGTLGQASQSPAAKSVSAAAQRLRQLADYNRAANAQHAREVQYTLVGRENRGVSNLPIQTAASRAIAETEAATFRAKAAARAATGSVLKKRWVKFGVQPASGGYILHTEHWEGDELLKTATQKNLSALAVREKVALFMSALYSVF